MQSLMANGQEKDLCTVYLLDVIISIFPASSSAIKFSDRNVDSTAKPVRTQCHNVLLL